MYEIAGIRRQAGNVAITGHRTTYLHPFYDLTEVAPGDKIVLTTSEGDFVNVAQGQSVVSSVDVSVVAPSSAATFTSGAP